MNKNTTFLFLLLIVLSVLCYKTYAAANETGDTRARPVSCYGKQADGTVTAILVDATGVVQTV